MWSPQARPSLVELHGTPDLSAPLAAQTWAFRLRGYWGPGGEETEAQTLEGLVPESGEVPCRESQMTSISHLACAVTARESRVGLARQSETKPWAQPR
jgi:hypothetical protein